VNHETAGGQNPQGNAVHVLKIGPDGKLTEPAGPLFLPVPAAADPQGVAVLQFAGRSSPPAPAGGTDPSSLLRSLATSLVAPSTGTVAPNPGASGVRASAGSTPGSSVDLVTASQTLAGGVAKSPATVRFSGLPAGAADLASVFHRLFGDQDVDGADLAVLLAASRRG
jgi:hypothetical protein